MMAGLCVSVCVRIEGEALREEGRKGRKELLER